MLGVARPCVGYINMDLKRSVILFTIIHTSLTLTFPVHSSSSLHDFDSINYHVHMQEDVNCNRTKQWPVNLRLVDTVADEIVTLNFKDIDYCKRNRFQLHVDGRAVYGEFPSSNMRVKVGKDIFQLSEFHFHWRLRKDKDGSFHIIDGKSYPMEMHLVHNKELEEDDDVQTKYIRPRKLLIIAILIDIMGPQENEAESDQEMDDEPAAESTSEALEFQSIIESLSCINKTSNGTIRETPLAGRLNLINLYPQNQNGFSYIGSLTVKNCNQHVRWIVYENPIRVHAKQIETFRHIVDSDNTLLTWNQFENSAAVPILNGTHTVKTSTKIFCDLGQ